MLDKIGLFTGSFDPITNGHVEIIERASRLFDTLYVGLFFNQEKKGLFKTNQRHKMIVEALQHLPKVKVVVAQSELAVTIARRLKVTTLVRGLRNGHDLDYEANLAFFNHELAPEIETIFLMSQPATQYISSSRIRELIAFQQDISAYVPESVVKELEKNETEKTD